MSTSDENDTTPSLAYMILADGRQQNRRIFKVLLGCITGWLITIMLFAGYVVYDRFMDANNVVETMVEQSHEISQEAATINTQVITNTIGDKDGSNNQDGTN